MKKEQISCNLSDIMFSIKIDGISKTISRSQIANICSKAITLYKIWRSIKTEAINIKQSSPFYDIEKDFEKINNAIDRGNYKTIR